LADLAGGQKTGLFLDQRNNRQQAGSYAALLSKEYADREQPLRILDCFCYSGGFAVHAANAASQKTTEQTPCITAVDVSPSALELARKNAGLNEVSGMIETVQADVFDFLRSAERRREKYGLVILDPPAFAKNRAALENALRGYKEINLRALKLLDQGGILVTCSCSHAVDESRFKAMITDAAADADRRIIQLDFCCQPPDHPILVGYDESLYLKCGFYRVL
jgi:23S rRNA (cytosine1962-C5)-methyltransferase